MESLKNGLQFLLCLTLLAVVGFLVWYLMFYMTAPDMSAGGTLVQHTFERAGKLVTM